MNRGQGSGYIAITAAIVISAVLVLLASSLSVTGYFARFNILAAEYKETTVALAEACADLALWRLASDSSYGGNESVTVVGAETCMIKSVTHLGGQYVIETQGIFQKAVTNIRVAVDDQDLSIISWEEIPTL